MMPKQGTASVIVYLFFFLFLSAVNLFVTKCASAQSPYNNFSVTSLCDFCIASQGVSPLEIRKTGIRYDLRYLHLSKAFVNGSEVTNEAGEEEDHFTQQFTGMYEIAPRTSLVVILPYVSRSASSSQHVGDTLLTNVSAPNSPLDHGIDHEVSAPTSVENSGLGDMLLLTRISLYHDHSISGTEILAVTVGSKLPTGNTSRRDVGGNLLDPHLQLGTGSIDFLAGANALWTNDRTTVSLNALTSIAGKGANGHQFGNSLNYDAVLRYRVYPADVDYTSYFAVLGISGELRGEERQDGEWLDGSSGKEASGGHVLFLNAGAQVFLDPSLSIEASFQLPVYHGLQGEQLGETYRITSGIQYGF